ncbi:RlpA-like double-psi beta-barrel-protein domain-containing protein-containing protein [Parasitella parasitica]|nr:RlpA-like double-psi beta-barrel-protein domain-containing protein-containing protein [Parasitella parasitica]
MNFFIYIPLFALAVAHLINVTNAFEIRGRGIATIMEFNTSPNISPAGVLQRRGRGTWYDGDDLGDAACYGRNGLPSFDAKESHMIGAMAMNGFENCYKCMKITNNKDKKKTVVVKIVDKCAGCQVGKAIDLTPAAFKKLHSDLNTGVLDISWKIVDCPSSINNMMPKKKSKED